MENVEKQQVCTEGKQLIWLTLKSKSIKLKHLKLRTLTQTKNLYKPHLQSSNNDEII